MSHSISKKTANLIDIFYCQKMLMLTIMLSYLERLEGTAIEVCTVVGFPDGVGDIMKTEKLKFKE
jgi:deoxyribose-phosphate aldolase|tara:strand:- start:451 stop:645 length:195 start_codon:yes stop_codon:yes gene_type:complete